MMLFAIIGSIALIAAVTVIAIRIEDVDRSRFRQAIVPANPADAVSSAEVLRNRYVAMAIRAEQLLAQHEASLALRWYLLLGAAVVVGLAALLYARHRDVTRGTAVLTYDLETSVQQRFSRLLAAFTEFASCDRVWHIREKGAIEERTGSSLQ